MEAGLDHIDRWKIVLLVEKLVARGAKATDNIRCQLLSSAFGITSLKVHDRLLVQRLLC